MATSAPPSAVVPTASPLAIVETIDVAYETPDPRLQPGLLDVFAPTTAGPWPVAVMFHGSPPTNTKSTWQSRARDLASHGFVVFVPSWGHAAGTALASPGYDELRTGIAETACAVAFAQSHARSYGGDPSTTVVFGHSAGANVASVIAFARPAPTAGCIGATSLGPIHALVSWDGDWMMIDPTWDAALAADPRLFDLYTPLASVAAHKDLRVVMLRSKVTGPYIRYLEDPAVMDAFFAVRDPAGNLREQVESLGSLADGQYDLLELQAFFYAYLEANGNPVTLEVLPGTTHDIMSDEAVPVLLAAFGTAAVQP
jgi:acetyl esterase/lipase